MMLAVICHGPQGCGKSRNRDAIRDAFGLIGIVDGWEPGDPVKHGHLHLTYCKPQPGDYPDRHSLVVVSFDHAMDRVQKMLGGA